MEHVELSVGIAEGEIFEINVAADLGHVLYVGLIKYVGGGIKQLTDTVERCFTLRVHTDKLGNCHNGPDYCVEITDKLDELCRLKGLGIYQISAVTENNADYGFDKQSERYVEKHGELCVFYVPVLVDLAELLELKQLASLFDEGFDDRYTREGLLREVGEH